MNIMYIYLNEEIMRKTRVYDINDLTLQIFVSLYHPIIGVALESPNIILISNQHTSISGQIIPSLLLTRLFKIRFKPNPSNIKN